jgi:hypothetical protein
MEEKIQKHFLARAYNTTAKKINFKGRRNHFNGAGAKSANTRHNPVAPACKRKINSICPWFAPRGFR